MKKAAKLPGVTPQEQLDRHNAAGDELRRICLLYLNSMQHSITTCPTDSESIHQFRVAGKRLRALFHLMQDLYPEDIPELTQTIADCCRRLSGPRDQQVQHTLLSQLYPDAPDHVRPEIRAWLKQHTLPQTNTAPCDQRARLQINKILDQWIKRFECWQPETATWSSLLYRWQTTRTKDLKLTRQFIESSPVDLHHWRKVSKRHLYQSELLGLETRICHKQLKQKNHLLGEWHDLDVLQHSLSGYLGDYLIQLQQQIEHQLLSQVLSTKKLI